MRLPWSSQPRRVRPKPLLQVPFVGRETELAALDRHLQVASEGSVQCVALEGPPGSGKSALLTEFALMHGAMSEALLLQLHAGECLIEQEFYVSLFDLLRMQSMKVLHRLYNETKRLRKMLAVHWDETEFCQFLTSADWIQFQEQPRHPKRRGAGRADPLEQLLTAVHQHPWAVGAATILDLVTRQASGGGGQEPGAQRWMALLRALQARRPASRAVLILLIDQLQVSLPEQAMAGQRWRHHWRVFAEATREPTLPLLVVWAGTPDSLQPVRQALPDTEALTVYTLGALAEDDYQRLAPRLQRVLPRPAQGSWQRLEAVPPEWYRYPGALLLATTWMAVMTHTSAVEKRGVPSLTQADATALVDDLVQAITQRHPEAQGLFRQLLDACAFLPPGKEFTVEDILPLCNLDALDLDVLAGRAALETLLGDCVRYGLLAYDAYAERYTSCHGMIQGALQHLTYPDPAGRQAVARCRRLATAVLHHVQRGESTMLGELTRMVEAEDGEDATALLASYLVSPLRRILVQSTKDERQRIAYALGKFRSPLAVDVLMTMLSDGEGQVRSRAVQSLADLDGLATSPALFKACRDSNSDVRWIAAFALGKMKSTTTVDALIEMLTDEDKEVGRIAAQGLGTKGDTRAVPHLIAAMRDSYPLLRESAALALGQLADRRALPALQERLQDSNRQVRRSAEKALARFSPSVG